MEDITRDELKDWLNKNAFGVADAFNRFVGIGLHPFLYTKKSGKDLLVMKYNRDKDDEVIGTITLPRDARRYASALALLMAKVKAVRDWWMPHPVSGRRFLQKQTELYPTGPQEKGTLFYVILKVEARTLLTYPGSNAVRTFTVRPEAQAAASIAGKKDNGYHKVMRVIEGPATQHDEISIHNGLTEQEGWYVQAIPAQS